MDMQKYKKQIKNNIYKIHFEKDLKKIKSLRITYVKTFYPRTERQNLVPKVLKSSDYEELQD